ncbi:hypothetical protein [Hyphococcus lacteus]|uniref:Uncharacterized protein n=1 Tax=Hyphococcus lacteus TaxID=3143536 RepID=A0ABV3Z524_9PROT
MGREKLPHGVPSDNMNMSYGARERADVPDVATPKFENSVTAPSTLEFGAREKRDLAESDTDSYRRTDDDDDLDHEPAIPVWVLISIAIAFLLVGLGAYLVSHNNEPMPRCENQPEWNQYNCKVR